MDTKYKTEATERKAPEISVSAHLEDTTEISVRSADVDGAWLCFSGNDYPSVSVCMSRDKLAEIRDVIAAYLEAEK